jgi:hypothetical protein
MPFIGRQSASVPAVWQAAALPLLAQSGEVGGYAVLEWLIVVVMFGLALFAVCRTSRRN